MSSAIRCSIPVNNRKEPREELDIALSKLKKKMKESGVFTEFLEHTHFRRPGVKKKDKRIKAAIKRKMNR